MSQNMFVNCFEVSEGKLCIHDVIDNNTDQLNTLLGLYRELFPDYLSALPRVREKAALPVNVDPLFVRHQWAVLWNGAPAGLASFKLAIRQNLGLCFSIGVLPPFRSLTWGGYHRLSHFLIWQMIRQLEQDAASVGNSLPLGLVVEVETSATVNDPVLKASRDHLLERYLGYGFVHLPVKYHEPASVRGLSEEAQQKSAPLMHLCMLPLRETDQDTLFKPVTLKMVVDALLLDHYLLPENHWIVKQAYESIEANSLPHI